MRGLEGSLTHCKKIWQTARSPIACCEGGQRPLSGDGEWAVELVTYHSEGGSSMPMSAAALAVEQVLSKTGAQAHTGAIPPVSHAGLEGHWCQSGGVAGRPGAYALQDVGLPFT